MFKYNLEQDMVQAELQRPTIEYKSFSSPLNGYINHFDTNWQSEGLPKDWFNLKRKVGFSMDTQMQLLAGTDKNSVGVWSEQTKQDILGFSLEYLSQGLVFPIRYEKRQRDDGQFELYDPKYNKSMLSGVSDKERNGEVVRSLSKIEDFFLNPNTPDGSFAIMPSPKGETGLTTDDGRPIFYPDSYFYIMTKLGDEVRGFTIKTDFSLAESRAAIKTLTGIELPQDASSEEYVGALALIKKEDGFGIDDIVDILRNSRDSSEFAFEERGWSEVEKDIKRGFELYNFNNKTQAIIEDFEQYAESDFRSETVLRKALAATILRLSKLFLFDQTKVSDIRFDLSKQNIPGYVQQITFGDVLDRVSQIPGCAGGGISNDGKTSIIDSLISRIGKSSDASDEQSYSFDKLADCVMCNEKKMVGPCNLCQGCDMAIRAKNNSKLAR